jgi:tetratricopeptide (TPR) repeat protein
LSIAGARAGALRDLPLATLVSELSAQRRVLSALSTTDDPDTDLRSVFSWSYRALSPLAAWLFRRLADHPGLDVAVPTTAALADVTGEQARAGLAELTRANLVQQHEPGRYQLHDLLRAYADEVARVNDSAAERRAATGRCLDNYLITARVAMSRVDPRADAVAFEGNQPAHLAALADRAAAVEWLDGEHANLIAAAAHAEANGWHQHAWQLPVALQYFFDISGRVDDWLDTHHRALASTRHLGDERAEALVLKNLAIAYWLTTRFDEALDHNSRALDLYRRSANRAGEAEMLNHRGLIDERVGRYDEAIEHLREALELRLANGERRGVAVTLQNLGNVLDLVGRYEEAIDHYLRALSIFRELGERRAQAIVLANTGMVQCRVARYEEALESFRAAMTFTEAGDHWVVGNTTNGLGVVLNLLGRRTEAVEHHLEALRLIRQVGDRAAESDILNNLGVALRAAGQLEQALDHHRQALELAGGVQHRYEEARAHDGIAHAIVTAEPEAARDHWARALAIYDDLKAPEAGEVRRSIAGSGLSVGSSSGHETGGGPE